MSLENEITPFENLTEVQSFFFGQCIFITGVTGLVGKAVVEKLLRSCPGIGIVYVLLREKRGKDPQQRLEKIFNLPLFRCVAEILPDYRKKVQPIEGDITKTRLGMSFEDFEKIRQNVSIIIHSAANVKFLDPLRTAVEHNILPVIKIVEMCKEMPLFKVLVHVSTCYVKREPDGSVLEQIPKLKITPFQLLDAFQWIDEKTEKAITQFLLEKKFNTYMISKALAEGVVAEKRGDLAVAIVRPCYIASTYKEPFPGWTDSIQGIHGLMLAASKGVLRALPSTKESKIIGVPLDIVVNTIITSAWHAGMTKPAPLFIINCGIDYYKLPYTSILNRAIEKRVEYPLVQMFRYPDFTLYYNIVAFYIHAVIDQYIPAIIIDFLLYIFTGKTILVKIYYKIHTLYGIFYKIAKDPWIYRLDNLKMLNSKLSPEDAKIFFMDEENWDWFTYMDHAMYGGRVYVGREDPSNIPYAKKKATIWWAVTTTLKWMIISYAFYYLYMRYFSERDIDENMFKLEV